MSARHHIAWILCAFLLAGCATAKPDVRDTPEVEMLRLKITKVRNAVDETRATIAVSRGATYLPELYLRLAELLSEEARYHYQLAYEREQRRTRALHVPQVRLLKEDAIGIYELIVNRFPDSELAARALFNMGHEHRELGNYEEMEQVLNRLVSEYPESPLKYDALLVMGDYHFDKSELDQAKSYYDQIVDGTLQRVTGIAHYKLGWVYVNRGKCKPALSNFEDAIDNSNEWEDFLERLESSEIREQLENPTGLVNQQIDVRREALVDLAYCYSREKKAKNALEYVRNRAYDRDTYVAALDRFARRYRTMSQPKGTISLTRELLRLAPAGEDRLDDARSLHAELTREEEYGELGDDVELIVEAYDQRFQRIDQRDSRREELTKNFELLVRDLVTKAQERLKKKPDDDLRREVIAAYHAYAETFTGAEKLPEMLLNASEVLAKGGRYLEAGQRAVEAADLLEETEPRANALYDGVVNFQNSLSKESNRARYERVTARATLRRAGEELLRLGLTGEKRRRVEFAIAQTYYDEGRYFNAINKLTAVAYEYPDSKEGDAAIQLVLDSYKTLNDFDGLMLASQRFLDQGSPASSTLKAELKKILAGAEQRKLDEASLTAAGEDGDLGPLLELADRYEGTDLGERAILNAFVAARAVGDSEKMYELADELAEKYPKSEQLPGIYTSLAQMAVARFDYDTAIEFMEKAANVNPSQQTRLLITAGELLEELGNFKGARNAYVAAVKNSDGAAKADPLAHLAALLEKTRDAGSMVSTLKKFQDLNVPAVNARLGLAQVATGKPMEGEMTLQSVFQSPDTSGEAQARAHYGMAEVMLSTLNQYPTPEGVDLVQEFITLVEVTQQSYLNAARQASPVYTAAAFSRLAHALRYGADKLESADLGDLSADQAKQIEAAIAQRTKALRQSADQAIEACAQQAWNNFVFNDVVAKCMKGEPYDQTLIAFHDIRPRNAKGVDVAGGDVLRQNLSKNPEDTESLRKLGEKLLDAGDPHAARLVFARAAQVGGGAEIQNLLGIASYTIGDIPTAFDAFARAAEAGLEAGRQNLAQLLREEGLAEQSKQVMERFQEGGGSGRLLKGGKAK